MGHEEVQEVTQKFGQNTEMAIIDFQERTTLICPLGLEKEAGEQEEPDEARVSRPVL